MKGVTQWQDYRYEHHIDKYLDETMITENSIDNINMSKPIHRLEQYISVSATTSSSELSNVFWLMSPSSDTWLKRIVRFPRSCTAVSMVGYMLGLGARHTSKIMIDRQTDDVIHIDFGDCFDSAKNCVPFPELIPFRISRMMISAFGIGGYDADFRHSCELVMEIARENINSLASILELFAQDEPKNME